MKTMVNAPCVGYELLSECRIVSLGDGSLITFRENGAVIYNSATHKSLMRDIGPNIVEAGVADTCGDFCKCWLVKDECMSIDDVKSDGLEACLPDDRPKTKDTVMYNGVTRVVFAFGPMIAWFASQYRKD